MPENPAHTPPRQIRIGDDWEDFDLAAKSLGTDRAALIRDYIAWCLHRPYAPKKLQRPDPSAWQPAADQDETGTRRRDQLRDRIRQEGGRWDGQRALAFYQETGFNCTLSRARTNLRMVAEDNPGLLNPAEKKRWTYDTTEET